MGLPFLVALLMLPASATLTVQVVQAATLASPIQEAWLDRLEQSESQGSTTVRILDTNGKYSYGCLQFQMKTWLAFGKDLGATAINIYDCELQRQVALSMLNQGLDYHWLNSVKRIGHYPLMQNPQ